MYQVVFLFMVAGLLFVIWRGVSRPGPEPTFPVSLRTERDGPRPPAEGSRPAATGEEGAGPEDGSLSDLSDVEVQVEVVDPEPFVERTDALSKAAVLEARRQVDADAILYLVQKIRAGEPPPLAGEPALRAPGMDKPAFSELTESPHGYRGELIEVVGNLYSQIPGHPALVPETEILFDYPNPAGIPLLYRAYVLSEGKWFLGLLWKKDREWAHMDGVRFRGLFSQLYRYELEIDGKPVLAAIPLLVGESFEPLDTGIGKRRTDWEPIFALVIGLSIVAGAVILVVSGRGRTTYQTRRTQARRQAAERRQGGDGPSGPDSSGEPDGDPAGEPAGDPAPECDGAGEAPDPEPREEPRRDPPEGTT